MSEASSAADTTATTATATTATTTATTATTTATAPNKVAFDEAELVAKTHKMFTELAKYVKGELTMSAADYKLLEQMNNLSAQQYAGMTANANELSASMHQLSLQYAALQPQLEQIERLGASIEQLENTVRALDRYTLHLAEKVRTIDPNILVTAQQTHLKSDAAAAPASGTGNVAAVTASASPAPSPAAAAAPSAAAPAPL